jgi:hypothetical protein
VYFQEIRGYVRKREVTERGILFYLLKHLPLLWSLILLHRSKFFSLVIFFQLREILSVFLYCRFTDHQFSHLLFMKKMSYLPLQGWFYWIWGQYLFFSGHMCSLLGLPAMV